MWPQAFLTISLFILFTGVQAESSKSILDFGAKGDGKNLCTEAIQAAINAVHNDGGGTVVVPSGYFLTGTIQLKSNVNLHLKKNAWLVGSTNIEDYYSLSKTTATYQWPSLIVANNASHVSITGKGNIDGQGKELALNIDDKFYAGQLDSSLYQLKEKRPVAHVRPMLLQFVNCLYVGIKDVNLYNASSWVQTYDLCKFVSIDGIKVMSTSYWNNDGIDIVDCHNVRISNCFVNSSDDGICLKSYKRRNNEVAINDSITITNCIVRSSASAVKLGTSSYGGFKNIDISDIKVYDTYRSAIAIESWENGIVENVKVKNVRSWNTGNAIFIRLGSRHGFDQTSPGSIKNVQISNVKATVPYRQPDWAYELRGPALPFFHNIFPASIVGLEDLPVEEIMLEDIKLTYPGGGNAAYANAPIDRLNEIPENASDYPEFSMFGELPAWGLYVRHASGITMRNIRLKAKNPDYRYPVVFDDVKNSKIEALVVKGERKKKDIILNNSDVPKQN